MDSSLTGSTSTSSSTTTTIGTSITSPVHRFRSREAQKEGNRAHSPTRNHFRAVPVNTSPTSSRLIVTASPQPRSLNGISIHFSARPASITTTTPPT